MTTYAQDQEFIGAVLPLSLLDESIKWISDNLEPTDVFDEDELKVWIKEEYILGDLFSFDDLAVWALENSFIQVLEDETK